MEKREIGVYFPDNSNEGDQVSKTRISLELTDFIENNPVEFSAKDEERLLGKYAEAEQRGLRGLLHIVNYDSFTATPLKESLPQSLIEKGYYQRLYICAEESRGSEADTKRNLTEKDTVVYVKEDGSISQDDKSKLVRSLQDRTGIIMGGGSKGDVNTERAVPILKALEGTLEKRTPTAGICLGHQYLWAILQEWGNNVPTEESVQKGYLETGPVIETVTKEGQENPVFGKLGSQITVVSFNEYHMVLPGNLKEKNQLPHGQVLTRNKATGSPTGLSLNFEVPGQVITTQRHPEVGIQGTEGKFLIEEKRYPLPSGGELIVPVGSHPDLLILASYLSANIDKISQKYDISEEDVKMMFSEDIQTEHLGRNFYGPLVEYLADIRLKQ